jgi:hypothetical protein
MMGVFLYCCTVNKDIFAILAEIARINNAENIKQVVLTLQKVMDV